MAFAPTPQWDDDMTPLVVNCHNTTKWCSYTARLGLCGVSKYVMSALTPKADMPTADIVTEFCTGSGS